MTGKLKSILLICIILLTGTSASFQYCLGQEKYDPVTMDPQILDSEFPAAMVEAPAELISDGKRLNGIFYLAQGKGPHPTVLLLHGLPGNERNLDLAQALRRAGWNVVFFHYRGSWGSEGEFSFINCWEDIKQVLKFIRSDKAKINYRIDGDKIILVGHSMGGGLALMVAAYDPDIQVVVTIAAGNLFSIYHFLAERKMLNGLEVALERMLPLNVSSGKAIIDEMMAREAEFNSEDFYRKLADKNILLIAGSRDKATPIDLHHARYIESLKKAGSTSFTEVVLDADHAYSDKRIELTRTIISWLENRNF